jgi:hypothetical protein
MDRLKEARQLMADFGQRTGLSDGVRQPRRYLWTDAYAVCNDLDLDRRTGDAAWRQQALQLVDQVHHVLGRHRTDDSRTGWISGLSDTEGERRPTAGGLRIGKPLPERRPGEPFREQLEWDRDGQYFHYLTKWMHALARITAVTGESIHNRQAIELAQVAHARFTYRDAPEATPRMYWKMSIDLSRPLVPSMGHLDPLDGLVTYLRLQATAARDPLSAASLDLQSQILEAAEMCQGKSWITTDPLSIGGLLNCACELYELCAGDLLYRELLCALFDDAWQSLHLWRQAHSLTAPPKTRLAFRELGLSIGLRTVRSLIDPANPFRRPNPTLRELDRLLHDLELFLPFSDRIEREWLDSDLQRGHSWMAHQDINSVMLATSLLAAGDVRPTRGTANSSGD